MKKIWYHKYILVGAVICVIIMSVLIVIGIYNQVPSSLNEIETITQSLSHVFSGDSNEVIEYTFDEYIIIDGRDKEINTFFIPIHFVIHQPYHKWIEEPDCMRIFPPCGYNTLAYREFNITGYEYIYDRLELIINNDTYKVNSDQNIIISDSDLFPINDIVSIPLAFSFTTPPYESMFKYKFELFIDDIGGQG